MRGKAAGVDKQALDKRLTVAAWAAFLAMWGVTLLAERLAQVDLRNLQYVCVGLILLGLNAARFARSIPMSRLTVVVSLLALLSGLVRQFNGELDVVSAVLITAGSLLLAYGIMSRQSGTKQDVQD